MKRLVMLFMCFLCLLFSGCRINKKSDFISKQNDIISLEDNQTDKSDLITQTYTIDTSGAEFLNMTMTSVNQKYKIQCLRKNRDKYYCVIKDDTGGLLYLLFEEEGEKYVVSDYWHVNQQIYQNDFLPLQIRKSKLSDVRNIDKYGNEMLSIVTGRLPFSTHKTIDGYYITITYNADYTIEDISYQKEKSRINCYILKDDFIG